MKGLLLHLGISLRLHFRNRMAMLYSYLFPVIFLVAFWVLYRYETIPLIRHIGELLTVTVLGGACFGLPTSMVSERERGVWRRYRLAPVATGSLVTSTLIARYLILITGGVLQIALAMAFGMPLPRHPFDLWLAFTFVSFAFLGLGLVIATMADTVPAVQALGQCIFLPMLIIGGVAVPLASLPEWAQRLSAFFPGRYAVEALQSCANGDGLGAARFPLLALLLIGVSGSVTGAKMFRWDSQQRFTAREGKGWVAVMLAAWAAVGLLAESRDRVLPAVPSEPEPVAAQTMETPAPPASVEEPRLEPPPRIEPEPVAPRPPKPPKPRAAPKSEPEPPPPAGPPASWQQVTMTNIDRDLNFDRLPPDDGIVAPIAPIGEEPSDELLVPVERMRRALPAWIPGHAEDPVQRVRNLLFVAAVPDVFQIPIERFAPRLVYEQLKTEFPDDELLKLLYWVAQHPNEGSDAAVDNLRPLGLGNGPSDMDATRERVRFYALKLIGRITGKVVDQ